MYSKFFLHVHNMVFEMDIRGYNWAQVCRTATYIQHAFPHLKLRKIQHEGVWMKRSNKKWIKSIKLEAK